MRKEMENSFKNSKNLLTLQWKGRDLSLCIGNSNQYNGQDLKKGTSLKSYHAPQGMKIDAIANETSSI